MKFVVNKFRRNIPARELIDDVKAVAKKLGQNTVNKTDYLKHGKFHSCTLKHRFRSWYKVMELAGLQPSRSEYNIDIATLFKNLEEVWVKVGKQPTTSQMLDPQWQSRYSVTPYLTRYGTWGNVLEKFIKYKNGERAGSGRIEKQVKIPKRSVRVSKRTKKENRRVIPGDLRFRVFLRDGFRCKICSNSPLTQEGVELHCDHIKPWSKGGKTVVRNLQTLCAKCNLKKSSKVL